MPPMRTQVAIIGAGPAGLVLAHLLHQAGIQCTVLERHARDHVEARIRAGVLEHDTVALLKQTGLAAGLERDGLRHGAVGLSFGGRRHRLDLETLTDGKAITVYGQHRIVADLIALALDQGIDLRFETPVAGIESADGHEPRLHFLEDGRASRLGADFIAGCDGFHGTARATIPASVLELCERTYPFAWLGILAEAPPTLDELTYARHDDGFALCSMRSPEITRLYLQVPPEDDPEAWPDSRIWDALHRRLETADGFRLNEGPLLQKSVTAMRSFVAEPMRWGRLFLAGDAAHIVPPTGAKGLNLAVADVRRLAAALAAFYRNGDEAGLERYSSDCLARVWRVQRFSWWLTSLLHRFPHAEPFDARLQLTALEEIVQTPDAAREFARHYVGLPFA